MRSGVLLILVLASAVPLAANGHSANVLGEFELMQYLAAGRVSPQTIIGLDNNGEILLACRQGCIPQDLRRGGVEVTESQLQLLRVTNLLQQRADGSWITGFPILGAEATSQLRAGADAMARQAVVALRSEIEGLDQALLSQGIESHAFAIYFSYVLDGMVWGFLEEYQRVPPRRLSAARPFWAGEIWAIEPARDDRVGTASISELGMTLKILLAGSTEETARPLLAARQSIKRGLKELLDSGRLVDGEARELLRRFGIVDSSGAVAVPVIDESGRDAVFRASEELTSGLVDYLLRELDLELWRSRFGLRDHSQALVVLYYELMSSMISILEGAGVVKRPAILDASIPIGESGIRELVVLVDRRERGRQDEDADVTIVGDDEEDR